MQDWSLLQALANEQGQDHNALALLYVAMRAAAVPPALRGAITAARINQQYVHGQGHWPSPAHREAMACSCGHATCFKVLNVESVQRGLQRGSSDPLACPASPAHRHVCHTYSPLIVSFRNIVQTLWPGIAVVWDWVDIPGLPSFHFDATLLWPGQVLAPARFEIDGKRHFRQQFTARRLQDEQKDAVVGQLGVSMLRLHELDYAHWSAKIAQFVAEQNGTVRWTPAYHACLTLPQRASII